MTDKLKLKSIINKYRKKLGLYSWSIEVIIIDNKVGQTKNKKFSFNNYDKLAEAEPRDLSKRQFTIYFTKQSLNDKNLDKIVFHELLHVLFWNCLDVATQLGASTDEKTTNLLYRKLDKEEHFVIDKLISMYSGDFK